MSQRLERGLLALSWPLLLSVGLSFSLTLADAFFLSRVSDEAAGAVGAVLPALGAFVVCYSQMAQAASNVCSQLLGAGKGHLVPATRAGAVYFNLAFGLLLAALLFAFDETLPRCLGLSAALSEHVASYVRVIGASYCLKAVQVAYAGILNSRGQTRWVLAESAITNVTNVGLNVAGLYGLGWLPSGASGVAWASLTAQALGITFTLWVVHRGLRLEFDWGASPRLLWQRFVPVFGLGSIAIIEPLAYQAAQTSIAMSLVGLGAKALAARSYVFNFYTVTTILWCAGLAAGTQILVAHRVGERRYVEAGATLMRAVRLGVIGAVLLALLVFAAGDTLLHVMTQDEELIALAKPLLTLGIVTEAGRAVNIIVGGALRSSGDVRYLSFAGAGIMWGLGVPSAWLLNLGLGWGLVGVWWAMALDECTRAVVNLLRWRAGHWQRRPIVPQNQ